MEEAARRFKQLPYLDGLRSALAELPEITAANVLACAEQAMKDTEQLDALISWLIDAAAVDPFFRPAMRSVKSNVHEGLLLFDTPLLTLFLSVMPADMLAGKRLASAGSTSIVFPGHRSLYKFIQSGGATLSFWEAPSIDAGFTAPDSGQCRFLERRQISDGEMLWLDGRRHSFVIDHTERDLIYLQATTSAGRAPLTVEYDSRSFAFVGASSTDEVSSRTQMMLSLLRTMDRTDAVPVFLDMLENPHFYARWQTMRELLALDPEAALPHLRAMADTDPHPEVRRAAAATLLALFAQDAANLDDRFLEITDHAA
jgi:hypothetical protein